MAHNNLGNVYKAQGRLDEAIACYQRAQAVEPDHGEAINNLGSVLQEQGDLAGSVEQFTKALHVRPGFAEAYNNLGAALQELGAWRKSVACYDKSLRLRPNFAEPHYNRALVHLSRQDFERGWAEFDWRMQCLKYPRRSFEQPQWQGEPLAGRTLLVHAEQGFGDTLMFARYLGQLERSGGRVLFEVQPALLPLLRASGFRDLYGAGEPLPAFDLHVPLLSVPGLLGATSESIVGTAPYLAADRERLEAWRPRLAALEGFTIGIAWQGNREFASDRRRSIPLCDSRRLRPSRARGWSACKRGTAANN